MNRLRVAVLGVVCVLLAALEPARADDSAERVRIARERAEAEARFGQRRRDCEQRFAVTACVDEARAEHRQTLQRLRREEGVLDESQRRQRAAARLAAIEAKQRAERERAAAPQAPRPAVSAPLPRSPRAPAAVAPKAASAPASAADRADAEARGRARFEARQREAREHRQQAEQRQAQREQRGKSVAPLPDPAAR